MKLIPEVAEKYKATITPTIVLAMIKGERVEINMTTINLAQADKLVADGFKYLKVKPAQKRKKKNLS
ncbi:MAG: hypothetical protein H0X62_04120 [Bacteroidetes bacterium]|nr:hypothetical protein [Bacteroidota bacterium]